MGQNYPKGVWTGVGCLSTVSRRKKLPIYLRFFFFFFFNHVILYCTFVNYETAFGSHIRDALWFKLLDGGLSSKMVEIIKSLYSKVFALSVSYRLMVYKSITGQAPEYVSLLLTYVSEHHERQTRSTVLDLVHIPRSHSAYFDRAFSVQGPKLCRSEASPLGTQAAPSSIPTSGIFFRGDLVMKTFLRPFSLFRWFKKSSCQLLAKECALSTGKLPRRLAQEQFG